MLQKEALIILKVKSIRCQPKKNIPHNKLWNSYHLFIVCLVPRFVNVFCAIRLKGV